MCQWGNNELIEVTVPARLSYTDEERKKIVGIDACVAPIVKALNDGGVQTISSCCGHGKGVGNIALSDGRELIISPDFRMSREIERVLFYLWKYTEDKSGRKKGE